MIWLCINCDVPMSEAETENGICPTCGLKMDQLDKRSISRQVEFDLMITALMYGRKPQ